MGRPGLGQPSGSGSAAPGQQGHGAWVPVLGACFPILHASLHLLVPYHQSRSACFEPCSPLPVPSHEDWRKWGSVPPLLPSPFTGTCSTALWGWLSLGTSSSRWFSEVFRHRHRFHLSALLPKAPEAPSFPSLLMGGVGASHSSRETSQFYSTPPPAVSRRCHCQLLSQPIKGAHPSQGGGWCLQEESLGAASLGI